MNTIDSNGIRRIFNKFKSKFSTKTELDELRSIITGNIVHRVSGNFQDTSISQTTSTPSVDLIPVSSSLSGNPQMVNGKKFVAPVTGLYIFHCTGGKVDRTGTGCRIGVWYNEVSPHGSTSKIGLSEFTSSLAGSVTAVKYMNKNDYLTCSFWCIDASHTSISNDGSIPKFEFALIGF